MPRLCTVCTYPPRREIDAAFVEHAQSYRGIAGRFGVNDTSLQRHAETHLIETIWQSKELRAMLDADNLLEKLGKWHECMEDQYAKADTAGEIAYAANVARVGLAAIQPFAKLGPLGDIERRLQDLEGGKMGAPDGNAG